MGWGRGGWQGARWGRAVGARRARWQGRAGNTEEGGDGRGQKGKMAVAGLVGAGGDGGQMAGGSGAEEHMAGSLELGGPDDRGGRGWQGAGQLHGSCWRWWGQEGCGIGWPDGRGSGVGSLIG